MLYVFLTCATLYFTALQGTRVIISLYAHQITGSELIVGLLVGSYAFFPMLLAIAVGRWLDRIGAYRMSSLGGIGMLLALIIPIIFPRIFSLFFSQLLIGLSAACLLISLQKTIVNLPGNRDKLVILVTLTGSISDMLGPLFSGVIYDFFGFRITFGTSAVIVLTALMICVAVGPGAWKSGASAASRAKDAGSAGDSSFKAFRHVSLRNAIIAGGIVVYSKDLFAAYFPVYGTAIGLTPSMIGLVISITGGAAIAVRLMQVWLVKAFGRGRVMMGTIFLAGIAYLLIPLNTHEWAFVFIALLLGTGLGLGQPLSLYYVMKITPADHQGRVLGIRTTFTRGSQFFAPMLFGFLGNTAGVRMIFFTSSVVLLLTSWLTRLPGKEASEQSVKPDSPSHGK